MCKYLQHSVFIVVADGYRFAGFSLYISNSSTSKTDGHLCYHHTGTTLPSVFQIVNCNHLGQYVIIYNERNKSGNNPAGYSPEAIIELCNVEVNGEYTCLLSPVGVLCQGDTWSTGEDRRIVLCIDEDWS